MDQQNFGQQPAHAFVTPNPALNYLPNISNFQNEVALNPSTFLSNQAQQQQHQQQQQQQQTFNNNNPNNNIPAIGATPPPVIHPIHMLQRNVVVAPSQPVPTMDASNIDRNSKQKHAMDFLLKVRDQYNSKPHVYNDFLEIMKGFKSGRSVI